MNKNAGLMGVILVGLLVAFGITVRVSGDSEFLPNSPSTVASILWPFSTRPENAVTITPTSIALATGGSQTFSGGGGVAPYSYSIVTNVSGSTIGAGSGQYTAGAWGGLDVVRVTDANGEFAEAQVTVTATDTSCPGLSRWDGGGLTNNWSEPANWCNNTLPATGSTVVFDFTSSKNATVDLSVSLNTLNLNETYAGTVILATGTVVTTLNLSIRHGTFNVGSGVLDVNSQFSVLVSGIFNGGTGTVKIAGSLNYTGVSGAQFNPGTGTVEFDGINGSVFVSTANASMSFHNLTVNTTTDAGGLYFDTNGEIDIGYVLGTLTLINGKVGSGVVGAYGPVDYRSTFDGGGGYLYFYGTSLRTITLPVNTPLVNLMGLLASNTTVTTTGTGILNCGGSPCSRFDVSAGTLDIGNASLVVANIAQSGGSVSFDESGTLNSAGQVTVSGGTFNATDALQVDIRALSITNAGIFNAPTTLLKVSDFSVIPATGAQFNHNGGTVVFNGINGSVAVDSTSAGSTTFNNVTVDLTQDNSGLYFDGNGGLDSASVLGNLNLINGTYGSGTMYMYGDINVGPNFDGGVGALYLAGSENRSINNTGGINPFGVWTIGKSSGSTVTASGSFVLSPTNTLNLSSGTLYLSNNTNLTAGTITIGANGRLASDSTNTITIGSSLTNNGKVDLRGSGAPCPEADTILIRSSTPGSQRTWSGAGQFRLVDVDMQDMSASTPLTAYSSRNTGNNTNWTFDSSCPLELDLSPLAANLYRGQTQTFVASGGYAPRTFSLAVNNSGATINSSTGLYTAGTIAGVSDTVRVTDSFGDTKDASVAVIAGPPAKLGFVLQPGNTTVGQAISPAVQVALQDSDGNTVPGLTNAITISIGENPGGSTLSGTLTQNAVNGIATFSDLSLNNVGTGYTLLATATGMTSAQSSAFDTTAGAGTQLVFSVQPSTAEQGVDITPAIEVSIVDQYGNLDTTSTNSIELTINTNPAGGSLTGTTTVNAVAGIATFDNISIDNPGDGYTLVAATLGLTSAQSLSFNILQTTVVTNTNDAGPGSLRAAMQAANARPGPQTISFNIPGAGPHSITLQSALQTLTDTVAINGSTQPGFAGVPLIEVKQANSNNACFNLLGSGSSLRSLVINNCNRGIYLGGSGGHRVSGNYIGTNIDGSAAVGIMHEAVVVGSPDNLIGGPTIQDGNVIANNSTLSAPNGVGILLYNSLNTNIQGNKVGMNVAGTARIGGGKSITIYDSAGTIVGGDTVEERNLIAAGTIGVFVADTPYGETDGVRILGNYIGTDVTGNLAMPRDPESNYPVGISLYSAKGVVIGGSQAGEGNLISGPTTSVSIYTSPSSPTENISIKGNRVGTDYSGSFAIVGGQTLAGVSFGGSATTTTNVAIGGSGEHEGNLISGTNTALRLEGRFQNLTIKNNKIGTQLNGFDPIPNAFGIWVSSSSSGSSNIQIGGPNPGEGNTIAFSTYGAVNVGGGTGVSIRGNSIFENGSPYPYPDIDLGTIGPNYNDSGDVDFGPNLRQNTPVLTQISSNASTSTIKGTVMSAPSKTYLLDLYSAPGCSVPYFGQIGYGEAKTYLGSASVPVGTTGIAQFIVNLPVGIGDPYVSGTLTDPDGNTSELSQCGVVAPFPVQITGTIRDNNNLPLANSTVRLTSPGIADKVVTSGPNGSYKFTDVAATRNYTVTATRANYAFSPATITLNNVTSDQTGQNFVGTRNGFSIAGGMFLTVNGAQYPLSGVTVNLSGPVSRTYNGNAFYFFNDLPAGSYTVTGLKDGITFTPESLDVTITNADAVNRNLFGASASSLTGRIFFVDDVLRSMNADGSLPSGPLRLGVPTNARLAASRDGSKIAYSKVVPFGNGVYYRQIFTANADGTGARRLTIK